jgi:hypothetical protein
MLRFIALAPPVRPPLDAMGRASAMLLLILAQGIFADWIAHLLLAATSAINWGRAASRPAWPGRSCGGEGEGFEPRLPPCE